MAKYSYKTQGTCSSQINIDVENGVINEVEFFGGCNGNLQGISRLVKGMKCEDALECRLPAGSIGTSIEANSCAWLINRDYR